MVSKNIQLAKSASNSLHEPISDEDLIRGFLLDLGATGRVDRTRAIYGGAVRHLSAFARKEQMPCLVEMQRDHVRFWLQSLYDRGNKPGGVSVRYRAVKRFFRWCMGEGERQDNPMDGVAPPKIPEELQPHYQEHEVTALLKSTKNGDAKSERYVLRDIAIIRTLYDSGVRSAELCGMKVQDLDWRDLTIQVKGKAGKERRVSIGQSTAQALERYMRKRRAESPWLWVGSGNTNLTPNGLRMMLERRFAAAGIKFRGAHAFRRAFAMAFLENGGQEGDLKSLAGWKSYQMVSRYTRATESKRAIAAHKKLSPGDRLNIR
jgi:site-specific recombinase XerD